ncbi:DUF2510 domain-containing protein [Streptomyces sp. NPDC048636]|uniref:DUF2510 domain-containing protein n=1 Tax=Streptomyces sp. NPDC048636 TaxID=3155762 RepID=UPI0034135CC3
MTTPPGWYSDPEHHGSGPAPERYWDGSAWTENRRGAQGGPEAQAVHYAPTMHAMPSVQGPPAPPGPPGQPPVPGYPGAQAAPGAPVPGYPGAPGGVQPGGAPGGSSKTGALVVAGVVLVAAVVGGVMLFQDDDDKGSRAKGGSAAKVPGGKGGGSVNIPPSGPSGGGANDPSAVEDRINHISVPLLTGWTEYNGVKDGVGLSGAPTPCAKKPEKSCARGGIRTLIAFPEDFKAKTAEGMAKEDIPTNAVDAYSKENYGGIVSHKELKSEAVTVAGQQGYRVLWQVDNAVGDDGYVQSLVFPNPKGTAGSAGEGTPKTMVLVSFAIDKNAAAPPLSHMDTITQGIKALN